MVLKGGVLAELRQGTAMPLRALSEAVAVLSLLAGLVFVGVEIHNSTAVARAESRREASAENIGFLMRIIENPELNLLWRDDWTLEWYDGLSSEDQGRVNLLTISLMLRLEDVYLQYSEGLLDESALLAYGMTQPKVTEPWFESYWRENYRGYLDPAFVSYFEDLNGY